MVFSFETDRDVSFLTDINSQIAGLKNQIQKGTSRDITGLFDLEKLRDSSGVTVGNVEFDIQRLLNLKEISPEPIIETVAGKQRFPGGSRVFFTTIRERETVASVKNRARIKTLNRNLDNEIGQRNTLLDFLKTLSVSSPLPPTFTPTLSTPNGDPLQIIKDNPLIIGAAALLLLI